MRRRPCSKEKLARGARAHPRLRQPRSALGEEVVAVLARHARVLRNVLVNLLEPRLEHDLARAERVEHVQEVLAG